MAILDYGFGNLRSVQRAVERVGGAGLVTSDPDEARAADAFVVPGVGAFAACVAGLRNAGLDGLVREIVDSGRPVLGVCLGMQVLFDWGEEGPADGLGILRGKVRRLPQGLTVPHMGWNEVRWSAAHPLTEGIPDGTRFYFVHSYVCDPEEEVTVGVTDYGGPFAAAVGRENVFATQFHPEKSGEPGLRIYANLVEAAA
ncbi:MAG TPA: imidazole glycerol phosphate synthase subunit HisH [Actinomycetota bacterium]